MQHGSGYYRAKIYNMIKYIQKARFHEGHNVLEAMYKHVYKYKNFELYSYPQAWYRRPWLGVTIPFGKEEEPYSSRIICRIIFMLFNVLNISARIIMSYEWCSCRRKQQVRAGNILKCIFAYSIRLYFLFKKMAKMCTSGFNWEWAIICLNNRLSSITWQAIV